jgi:flagella basal body P-ring formation protein FlgA
MNKLCKIGIWIAFSVFMPVVAWAAGSGSAAATFEIPENITVSGPSLSLNDLGALKEGPASTANYLKQVALGTVPAPGQVRIFNREYLVSILRQYNFPVAVKLQMGGKVVVKSPAACIRRPEIEQAIQDSLGEKKPHLLKKWVELHNIPEELWLNQGEWKIKASPAGDPSKVGNALFKVVISQGTESRVLNISGKIKAVALVYRAVRKVSYQALVNNGDFELVEMELQNGKELVGDFPSQMRTIKVIKQGEVLRTDYFQPIPLVSKAQEVKVVVQDENVAIKVLGIAKSDGWLGDEILINNPASNKVFKARVTGKGTVELNIR